MPAFKVALSGDFFDAAGKPAYPMFDLSPLRAHEDIELVVLAPGEEIAPERADQGPTVVSVTRMGGDKPIDAPKPLLPRAGSGRVRRRLGKVGRTARWIGGVR